MLQKWKVVILRYKFGLVMSPLNWYWLWYLFAQKSEIVLQTASLYINCIFIFTYTFLTFFLFSRSGNLSFTMSKTSPKVPAVACSLNPIFSSIRKLKRKETSNVSSMFCLWKFSSFLNYFLDKKSFNYFIK